MQKLKIKIKEFVEERRRLSLAERSIFYVSECEELKFQSFQNEAKKYLKDVGFFRYEIDQTGSYGTFRKETIRDATGEESDAWWYLFKTKDCRNRVYNNNEFGECNCIISGECINTLDRRRKAEKILFGKEIILELVESEKP